MKRIVKLIGPILAVGIQLHAITLTLTPSSTVVTAGGTVNLAVSIGGLPGPGLDPNVGSFDLFLSYDPLLVIPTAATFGNFLGDPNVFEALTDFQVIPANSWAEIAEVSLLSNADLDALQPPSFPVADISFDAIGDGLAGFHYVWGPIDDSDGTLIFGSKEIPEPAAVWLFAAGAIPLLLRGLAAKVKRTRGA